MNKFICDRMLGKLCRLMRACGIDTLYSNHEATAIIEARRANRILVTRNTQLSNKANIYYVKSQGSLNQLKDIIEHFSLHDKLQLFTRCLECNCLLQTIDKETVKGKVPYYTYKTFQKFALCPECQRVYWPGSHYENMKKEIEKILK